MGPMEHIGPMGLRPIGLMCPISPIRVAAQDSPSIKKAGICSAADLNAFTERLGTWLQFPPVCTRFHRGLH